MVSVWLVWIKNRGNWLALRGRFSPSSTSVVAANSDTVDRGIDIAVSGSLKSALFVESTGSDINA